MKLNLHNKVEIVQGGKTITAYNTMLSGVYSAIKNFKNYFSYIALGTGMQESNFNDTTLNSCSAVYALETDEISASVDKESMYIKKSVTFGENEYTGLQFSELGITDSIADNPVIYNRMLVKDKDGNTLLVEKRDGEALTIRMTIYLEMDEESKRFFTLGENNLIKQILGHNDGGDKAIYAIRGLDKSLNSTSIQRAVPYGKRVRCEVEESGDIESGYSVNIVANMANGETREVVFVYGEKAVARINISDVIDKDNVNVSIALNTYGVYEYAKDVVTINSVVNSATNEVVDSGEISMLKIANNLGERVIEEYEFSTSIVPKDNTKLYMSPDGGYFALTVNNSSSGVIFKTKNDGVTYLGFDHFSDEYTTARLYNSLVISLNRISQVFTINDWNRGGASVQVNADEFYEAYNFRNFLDFDACINSKGHLMLGVTYTHESGENKGVVAIFQKNSELNSWDFLKVVEPKIKAAAKLVAYPAEFGDSGEIVFFSNNDTYSGKEYATEFVGEEESRIVDNDYLVKDVYNENTTFVESVRGLIVIHGTGEGINTIKTYDVNRNVFLNLGAYVVNNMNCILSRNTKYAAEYGNDGIYTRLLRRLEYYKYGEFENGFIEDVANLKMAIPMDNQMVYLMDYDDKRILRCYKYDENKTMFYNKNRSGESFNINVDNNKYLGLEEFEGVRVTLTLGIAPPQVSEE